MEGKRGGSRRPTPPHTTPERERGGGAVTPAVGRPSSGHAGAASHAAGRKREVVERGGRATHWTPEMAVNEVAGKPTVAGDSSPATGGSRVIHGFKS